MFSYWVSVVVNSCAGITFPHALQAKPHDTLDLCGLINNDLARTVAKYPKRFVGLGTLPMQVRGDVGYHAVLLGRTCSCEIEFLQAPELAVKELRRCIKELKFPGVQIGSHVNEWNLDAPELQCVFAVSVIVFLGLNSVK